MSKSTPITSQPTLAAQADRHRLYELSVQCAESELDFVAQTFRELRGRPLRHLREDFCGTANVCCEWVRRDPQHRAWGIDLDPEVLAWGRVHNVAGLSADQQRQIELIEGDVLKARVRRMDAILAMNFSYWLFTDRARLVQYFRRVRKSLRRDGVFFLDAFGGYDSFREIEEAREIEDGDGSFTYVWDQASFNPVTNGVRCHIHFRFPDGSALEPAFSYEWRMYTVPEVCDMLREAGFVRVRSYWQGWDENEEADGIFRLAEQADADAGWICYLSAEK